MAGGIPLAIVLAVLFLSAMADAAQYYVWGRIYSSSFLPDGQTAPVNPLSGVPADQIVGKNSYAQIPRNLVKVRVIAATNGNDLGGAAVYYDGGYYVSFVNASASISAKFVVEELSTSKVLLESGAVTLSAWPTPNIRYVLVLEDLSEIDQGREFATPPIPGKHTAIFTRVGKIEVATEVGGLTHRVIDSTTGLVTVPTSVSSYLAIPSYQDSPLGGNLYVFGAFDEALCNLNRILELWGLHIYYRIRIDNLDTATSAYLNHPLVKTKYSVNMTTLTVKTDRITLGPSTQIIGGSSYDNCYQMTPLSSGTQFWSFPDLLALWRTGGLNGNYRLTIEIPGSTAANFAAVPNYTDLRMRLDNIAPTASILPLYSGAGDTPRIYTPGPAVPLPYDLRASLLGAPANYGSISNPICSILEFSNPAQHLAFQLTAFHDNGFMRYWQFSFRRNDGSYKGIIGKQYNGATDAMEDFSVLKITSCTQSDVHGFQEKFIYLNNSHVDLGSPDGCAYRFVIEAATRATDGYTYLYWSWDEDLHYLKKQ